MRSPCGAAALVMAGSREAVLLVMVPLAAALGVELAQAVLLALSHHLLAVLALGLLALSQGLLPLHVLLLEDGLAGLEVGLVGFGAGMGRLERLVLGAHVCQLGVELRLGQAGARRASRQGAVATDRESGLFL